MKLLFISKKSNGGNWSDSIDLLKEDLGKLGSIELTGFEVDTGGLKAYFSNGEKLSEVLREQNFDAILVHHVICAWPIRKNLKKFEGLKVIALHEAEPVLGFSFLLRNIFQLPIKHWIRYPGFWNSKPLQWFDQAWVLNKKQAIYNSSRSKYRQLNFLGVDEERFKGKNDFGGKVKVFFPFGPERKEKGFLLVNKAVNNLQGKVELITGGNIRFENMPQVYQDCQIMLMPSLFETYSLVVLEAMSSNLFLLVSKEIGLIAQLCEQYPEVELWKMGIFPIERNSNSIEMGIEEILLQIEKGKVPRTRDLFLKEGFDRMAAAKRVRDELMKDKSNEEARS